MNRILFKLVLLTLIVASCKQANEESLNCLEDKLVFLGENKESIIDKFGKACLSPNKYGDGILFNISNESKIDPNSSIKEVSCFKFNKQTQVEELHFILANIYSGELPKDFRKISSRIMLNYFDCIPKLNAFLDGPTNTQNSIVVTNKRISFINEGDSILILKIELVAEQ